MGRAVTVLAPPDLALFLESEGIEIVRNRILDADLFMRGSIEVIDAFAESLGGESLALGVLGNPLSDFAGLPVLLRALETRRIETEIVPGVPRATLSAAIAMPLVPLPPASSHHSWDGLIEIMARLRRSCPWDREQTHRSLVPYLIEETYEVADAIETEHDGDLCEELGDLLLQIVFHAQLATERGRFSVADVIDGLANKMIRRHPHVFADTRVDNVGDVWRNWEALKSEEAASKRRTSLLDGVPKGLAALQAGQKLQGKAARAGFDWPDLGGVRAKLLEELAELDEAIAERAAAPESPRHPMADPDRNVRDELGDVLFTVVNLARRLGIDAEGALRHANEKFSTRFRWMENQAQEANHAVGDFSLSELEGLWQQAKQLTANSHRP